MNVLDIGYSQILLSLLFVTFAGGASFMLQLGLHGDILWGTVRTVSQLFLMGYALRYIFALTSPWPILVIFAGMILFAARIISNRVGTKTIPLMAPTAISMLLSHIVVTIMVTAVVIQVEPWYDPRYFLPLGGMVVGNSMNAVAIALERLLSDLKRRRETVELYLSLGANRREASERMVREAVSAGMIPSINALMGAGIVFLPGMMTGQIIAGADPVVAVKYQIVVMLMLVASTTLGGVLAVFLVRRRCFSRDHRLLV